MLKMSSGFSRHLWPCLVPLVPMLRQPCQSGSQLGFGKAPPRGAVPGGVTGTRGVRRAFAVPARSPAPQSAGSGPAARREGSGSAPRGGSVPLARKGYCFIFMSLTIENAARWMICSCLQRNKRAVSHLCQKVKLLSYVSKKPITSSRPASTLRIYSLAMLYLPTISHLNSTENTRPLCIEDIVNCSR